MKISDCQKFELEFDCRQVGELLFLYVLDRGDLSLDERWAIERHLDNCTDCQKEHEETRFVNDALVANREYLIEKGVFKEPRPENQFKRVSDEEADFLQFQAKMQRAIARRKKTERQNNPAISRFAIKAVSAIAACLLTALGIWSIIATNNASKTSPRQPAAAISTKTPVKIELLTDFGSEIIQANQSIITSELKTLRINDNRRMILNKGTELSIVPHNLGCIVKLDKGEVYTEVEHDGKLFIVETTHGRAVITGTTFNIKANNKQMELTVTEGTVSFESDRDKVNVTAGQRSKIIDRSDPSIPLSCNTGELTAWATGYKLGTTLAKAKTYDMHWYLPLSLKESPIVLVETNYGQWVKDKREWFKTNFPWIFELKDALAKEGIEVDYPELLIKSGDAWQFVDLQKFPAKFSVPDFGCLIKTATSYGFNKKWLLKNIPSTKTIQDKSLLTENLIGMDALNQLLKYVKGIEAMPYYFYPADAGRYLAETRSLIWFAVRDGQYDLTEEEQAEILILLQKKVIAAYKCQNEVLYSREKHFYDNICQEFVNNSIGYIQMIKAAEERLAEYEIDRRTLRKEKVPMDK